MSLHRFPQATYSIWVLAPFMEAELARLASSECRFIYINGEKSLRKIWTELGDEFPEIFNL